MFKLFYIAVLTFCACVTPSYGASSAFQPTKAVTLIVPFPPGGGTDRFSRILGAKLTDIWGQQVVVENRGGAQGSIGTAYAAKAAPDGYTLLVAHQGVFTVNPNIYKDIGFDPFDDFMAVSRATQQPFVLVAKSSLGIKTLKELIALAKERPGKLSFGSATSGAQLTGELLKHTAGIDLLHVAYKGAAPAVVDLLGGHIDLMVSTPPSVAQHVKEGTLLPLVLFGLDRISAVPDAPTASEAGYPELGDMPEWFGIVVPAGTPDNIVTMLNRDITTALQDKGVQESISSQGMTAAPSTPDEFSKQIRRDYDSWSKLIEKANIDIH